MKTIELEKGRMYVVLQGKCFIKKKFNAQATAGDKIWQTKQKIAYRKSLFQGPGEGSFDKESSSSDEAES